MKKAERQDLVKELIKKGEDNATIITEVVEASGATEATVQKDIDSLRSLGPSKAEKDPFTIQVKLTEYEQNNAEIAKGRVTEYEVPENEREDCVHVELETVNLDRNTGRKMSNPYIQKFDVRAWGNFRRQAKKLGITHVRVLYAPEGVDTEVVDPVEAESKNKK